MIPQDFAPVLHTYLIVFGGALLIYDYALTFAVEIERFWLSHQISVTAAFYFVNRYVGLLGYIPILYQYLGMVDGEECRKLQSYSIFYGYVVLTAVAGLMVIRIYALYNRDSVVLWVLGSHIVLTTLMCIVLQSLGIVQNNMTEPPPPPPPPGLPPPPPPPPCCVPYRSFQQGKVSAAVWSLKPLFDLMILVLTVCKSFKFRQTPRPMLIEILIADGILYFVASLALGISSICLSIWAPPFLRAVGTPLTIVISSVLVSRMTLNLRNPDIIPHSAGHLSEQFVSTILSLGNPSYTESFGRTRSEVASSAIPLRRMGSRGVD